MKQGRDPEPIEGKNEHPIPSDTHVLHHGNHGTGRRGGGSQLLRAHQSVRAVVRDVDKGQRWISEGCEVVHATMQDAAALTVAFAGAEGVFILPALGIQSITRVSEARAVIAAVRAALESARPEKSSACRRLARSRDGGIC